MQPSVKELVHADLKKSDYLENTAKSIQSLGPLAVEYTRAINKENEWDALVHIYYDKAHGTCCHQIPFEADLKLDILQKRFYKDTLDITEFKLDTVDFKIDREDYETETSLEENIDSIPVFEEEVVKSAPLKPILRQTNQHKAAKSLTWAPRGQLCDYCYIPRRKGWRLFGVFIKRPVSGE
ncbi:hypothetical protein AVEN_37681-1 [Araneus ventricosus]|uniref:Uncharacterized protein n=1 Tax=Araneus ventricosus TaxID=182803 RepID=A0A4Y2NL48_ARAVE|nr:hypothetical protein AVEN_37681-1 [Araneus ventricosus]